MTGYWLSFFACSITVRKLAKKGQGQFPAIFSEGAWSVKDLLYGFQGIFLAGHTG